jgi:putative tricarboxylic transport membrane protein
MDRICGMVVLSVGVGILWFGRSLQVGNLHRPGPGFFPTSVAAGLILLSLFLIFGRTKGGDQKEPFTLGSILPVVEVFSVLLVFLFLLEPLGFIVTGLFLMIFLFTVVGSQKWPVATLGAVIAVGFAYIVFGTLLKGNLPRGILG